MGTDTSHRGDSSQHTTPLPITAALPNDTPIVPTPEQVNQPEAEPPEAEPPVSGQWAEPSPAHIREKPLSV